MKVRVTRTVRLNQSRLKKVMTVLLPVNGPMVFVEERRPLMFEADLFEWGHFFDACSGYRQENMFDEQDFLVVLTELRNASNWFSGFSMEGARTVFVHASDWENYIYAESEYPIAYEIVANILQTLSYAKLGEDLFKYVHSEPIGCMNDMCGWKPDITFKLRTGDICQDCLAIIESIVGKGMIENAVALFEYLRKEMLFSRDWQKPMSFEENLPFTVAITKRKMGITLEPFRKMLMLIDHFDSLVRTSVLMLSGLSKTHQEMHAFLVERKLHHLPSLGNWVDALAALARSCARQFPDLQLPLDFASKVQQVVKLSNDHKITYIRNEKRGHGYIECQDSGYKGIFSDCIQVVEDMERLLHPLFLRFHYLHTISLNRIEGRKFKVVSHQLSGSNPAFFEKEIVTEFERIEELPIEDRFYLVTPDLKTWVDLDPYFKYGECSLCHHNRLLVYDGLYMLDPYIGHRFENA